jgi:hypothetical protein
LVVLRWWALWQARQLDLAGNFYYKPRVITIPMTNPRCFPEKTTASCFVNTLNEMAGNSGEGSWIYTFLVVQVRTTSTPFSSKTREISLLQEMPWFQACLSQIIK